MHHFQMAIPLDQRDRLRTLARERELASKDRDRVLALERGRTASLPERIGRREKIVELNRFVDREKESRLVGGVIERPAGIDRRLDSMVAVPKMESAVVVSRLDGGIGVDRRLEGATHRRLEIAVDLKEDNGECGRAAGRSASFERLRQANRDRNGQREKSIERAREDNGMLEIGRLLERRKDDSAGGFQDLVAQYKTALAELTFNSKPIITNLTIIAGENVHAAAIIAATVCTNILQVPNEQKLPSLYLLDSIVKNIGGEYVKHFAARLPEVFCTAYRQVDPSIYLSMRHLFRTWRNVFSGAPLRLIEEELEFSPLSNVPSSTSNSTKSVESPSQRPGHSIHVNPKYLEAQRRLQRSSKAETVSKESNGEARILEAERPDGVFLDSAKIWPDSFKSPAHLPWSRNEDFGSDSGYIRKMPLNYSDYDYGLGDPGPDLSGRGSADRDEPWEKGWLREGKDAFRLSVSGSDLRYSERNGVEVKHLSPRSLVDAYGNANGPRTPRMTPSPAKPVQDLDRKRDPFRDWKNSEEEEEYIWEDVSPRLLDNPQLRGSLKKVDRLSGGADKIVIPGGPGKEKSIFLDQPLSDHPGWRKQGHTPSLSLTDQLLPAGSRLPLHRETEKHTSFSSLKQVLAANAMSDSGSEAPALWKRPLARQLPLSVRQQLSPPAQPRTQSSLITVPNRISSPLASANVFSHSANFSAPLSSSGMSAAMNSSATFRVLERPTIGSSFNGGLFNFGSLSPVTPASNLLSHQSQQSQRPPSPLPSTPSQSLLPVSFSHPLPHQPSFQPLQQQQINYVKPTQFQGPGMHQLQPFLHPPPLNFLPQQQQPAKQFPQGYQVAQQPTHQLKPLHQLISLQSTPSLQPTSEQQSPLQQQQFSQTMPPTHLLHSLQQLHHHLPSFSSSLPQQPHASQSPQQLHSLPLLFQQGQLSKKQQPLPPHPQLQQLPQPSQHSGYVPQPLDSVENEDTPSESPQIQNSSNNLLEAFLQSGIMPSSQVSQIPSHSGPWTQRVSAALNESILSHTTTQSRPPIPNGPPPLQFSISSAGYATTQGGYSLPPASPKLTPLPIPPTAGQGALPSLANLPNIGPQPMRMFQPPLPPGPPPVLSQGVNSATHAPPFGGIVAPMNKLSSLLSSLMAQGVISAPPSTALTLPQLEPVMSNPTTSVAFSFSNSSIGLLSKLTQSGPLAGSSTPAIATVSATLVTALRVQAHSEPSDVPSIPASSSMDPIGTEFKQEILRERHESVIRALYFDFPRQCKTCGLRFKLQEEHSMHMDWHVSRNRRQKSSKQVSRKWFASGKEWLNGTGLSASEVGPSFFPEEVAVILEEHEGFTVPADENQSACALCGELFEDFYSDETEEWMYKGAVYLNAPPSGVTEGLYCSSLGPIVHAKCRSESATNAAVDSAEDDVVEENDELGHIRKRPRY